MMPSTFTPDNFSISRGLVFSGSPRRTGLVWQKISPMIINPRFLASLIVNKV
jgi:hypothetical protein